MRSLFARSLAAVLAVGFLIVSHQASAQTDSNNQIPFRVFGNDGLGIGRLPLGGIVPSLAGETHTILAQGFEVGATSYDLASVDIGLYIGAMVPVVDIGVYESVFDSAAGLNVPDLTNRVGSFDSVPTNNGGVLSTNATILYNFPVTGGTLRLQSGRNYWIAVTYTPQVSGAPSFMWNFASGRGTDTPREQTRPDGNPSGITCVGTVGKHDFVGNWFNHDATVYPPSGGLSFNINAVDVSITGTGGGGGGGDQTPPVLDCYALSKGFFKNKYPNGWPVSVIADGGAVIGGRIYTTDQLRTMLATNSTGGNQIGQLAGQLVAVHLSRELARQTAGPDYIWWNGWAPDSADAQAAYDQAAQLVGANAGFDSKGRLTGTLRNVSLLINALDNGYIQRFHCD